MANSPEHDLNILIIDDDRDLLDTLSIVLSSMDYQVTCVDSAVQGVTLMSARRFDLALVDLRMRRMDGNQFLKTAKLINPDCRVVLMSAYATAEAMVTAIRENVYDYLLKPFKVAELEKIFQRAGGEIAREKKQE
ncbi:MAG: response regulator [Armatimonadota bacterium]|nr:response regulator [Armatimonadota bacterium]